MIEAALIALAVAVLLAALLCLHPRTRAALKGGVRLVAALARDPRIPCPLRWLLLAALLPIPGPFEEICGGLAVGIIAWRYRDVLAEHRGK